MESFTDKADGGAIFNIFKGYSRLYQIVWFKFLAGMEFWFQVFLFVNMSRKLYSITAVLA